jgi:hypothetical protein
MARAASSDRIRVRRTGRSSRATNEDKPTLAGLLNPTRQEFEKLARGEFAVE